MSKQTSKRPKTKRDDHSESEDSEEDLQPIHFFVPGESIDTEVLVFYITRYVDNTAKITPSRHPIDKSRTGFNVTAKKTLNATSLRDLINDSKDWDTESQSRTFKKRPYRYAESDTAKRRDRQGASKGGTVRPGRQQREASVEQTAPPQASGYGHPKATSSAAMSGVPATAYSQYQQSQPHDYQRTGGGYYPTSSKPETGPNTYNIYNTSVTNTAYSANLPTASHHGGNTSGYAPYQSSGYAPQVSKSPYDNPPPSYEVSNARVQGRPPKTPDQPDPDAFDREERPRSSQPMDISKSRQGSLAPGEGPMSSSRPYGSVDRGGEEPDPRSQTRRPTQEELRRAGYRP